MNNNEPVILGKVKKGTAGKPMVVMIVFLFVGAFILFLPTIISYFDDYNIIDLIKRGQIVDFFINHDNYVNQSSNNNNNIKEEKETGPELINSKTVLKNVNFTLTNFNLTKEKIIFTINTNNQINFDESNYYLILSQNNKEIATIKLTDTVTNNKELSFNFLKQLDNIIEVKGIIKNIKESEYPSFKVSSDESGLGSFICEKDNYKIEYILNNNNLIRIKETLTYIDSGEDYLKTFEEYTRLVTKIINSNATASIVENYNGFIFTTDVDLTNYNNIEKNYNYYSLNTKTNIIKFEMNAKGYDCK